VSDGWAFCAAQCSSTNPACPSGYECDTVRGACVRAKQCGNPPQCPAGSVCVADGAGQYCALACDVASPVCPAGYACEQGACFMQSPQPPAGGMTPATGSSGGCTAAGARDTARGAWWTLFGAGFAGALASRRRRRAR
jgi:hypothetical protein